MEQYGDPGFFRHVSVYPDVEQKLSLTISVCIGRSRETFGSPDPSFFK